MSSPPDPLSPSLRSGQALQERGNGADFGGALRRGGVINCRAFFLCSVCGMTYAVKSRRLVAINYLGGSA